jgi:hypothetical protein
MIHVIFVPGMFGSMIEYALRAHTTQGKYFEAEILKDGSMHSYKKKFHMEWITTPETLNDDVWITTPIYPEPNYHLPEILKKMQLHSLNWDDDKKILIFASNKKWAEINMLFCYYKIALNHKNKFDMFTHDGSTSDLTNWNPSYRSWKDMQVWELREWFSLFYPDWISEWIDSPTHVGSEFLKISNEEIMHSINDSVIRIMNFCNLTPGSELEKFLNSYRHAQEYILKEYKLIEDIVQYSLNDQFLQWDNFNINIVSESIIQHKLREAGCEIRCDGLNIFPTNSKILHNLLNF